MNSTPSFFDQLAQSYRTAFVDWSAPDLNATDMVFCVVVAIVWAYLTDKWETQHREDLLSRQPPLSPKQITREMRWSHMGKLAAADHRRHLCAVAQLAVSHHRI